MLSGYSMVLLIGAVIRAPFFARSLTAAGLVLPHSCYLQRMSADGRMCASARALLALTVRRGGLGVDRICCGRRTTVVHPRGSLLCTAYAGSI